MSVIADLKDVRGGLASRFKRLETMIARTTAVPLSVRGLVWLAGALAMVLAWPSFVILSGSGLFLIAVAALPALAPKTTVVSAVTLVPVLGWLLSTAGYGRPVTLVALVALAGLLYLVHSAAALAAQLPYDAIVSPGVVLRWFGRSGLVIAGTAVIAVYASVASEMLRGQAFVLATLGGLAVAVGVAALLARLIRRG